MSEAKRLRTLDDENAGLNRLLPDAMLDNGGLKNFLPERWGARPPSGGRSRGLGPHLT